MINSVAKDMIDAVDKGDLNIEPAIFREEWRKWLTNPRDWCVSR